MIRKTSIILAGVLVFTSMFAGGFASAETTEQPDTDFKATDLSTGSNLSLAVSEMRHSFESELTENAHDNAIERSDDKSREIQKQLSGVAQEKQKLTEERKSYVEAYQNDEISQSEFRYKMIDNDIAQNRMNSEIDSTTERAEQNNVQVDHEKLDQIRNNASEMSGEEVSNIARDLVDRPEQSQAPEQRGPPEERQNGNNGDETTSEENND